MVVWPRLTSRAKRINRAKIAYVHDVVMAGAAYVLALVLRMGDLAFDVIGSANGLIGGVLFVAVAAVVFRLHGLYRGVWRYASVNDLMALVRAVSLVVLLFLPLMFLVDRLDSLPRSFVLIAWFVLLVLLGMPRFAYRMVKDRRLNALVLRDDMPRIPVLLVGAGDEAELFIRSLKQRASAEYEVVGLVSEKASRVGLNIHGKAVLGTLDDLERVIAALDADDRKPHRLVLTHDRLDAEHLRGLFERADALGVGLARMPRPTDLRDGSVDDALQVRPVAIEDLLGRPQARLDRDAMRRLVAGRRVMITGAGGSIGSELVRQVAALGPSHLVLLEASEYALYTIDFEVSERWPDLPRATVLADVRDRERITALMEAERPELVFHAAALKHVPLVEANPLEGILTNICGTRIVADACRAHGVRAMVLISTDKAVNPTNVMGTTKRVAEQYCQALDDAARGHEGATRFMVVRFGNVLGSTGSVVPLFQRQLQAGGPLTVTHPDMTRYFMTIREAVELVLQASALGTEADAFRGHVFVLDMGQPVRIVDLARQMIRLAGLRPDEDVQIVFTGLRPGEKLFEEIFHGDEPPVPTGRDGILIASPRTVPHDVLDSFLIRLETCARGGQAAAVMDDLRALVPEYQPGTAPPPVLHTVPRGA